MKAGFALAALLAEDRELACVEAAVPENELPALRAQLASVSPAPSPAQGRESGLRALLAILRPDLDVGAALRLPPRMRALVARIVPADQRKALLSDLPSRTDFNLDEDLLRALARIARGVPPDEARDSARVQSTESP